jgi:hypothetical protein
MRPMICSKIRALGFNQGRRELPSAAAAGIGSDHAAASLPVARGNGRRLLSSLTWGF